MSESHSWCLLWAKICHDRRNEPGGLLHCIMDGIELKPTLEGENMTKIIMWVLGIMAVVALVVANPMQGSLSYEAIQTSSAVQVPAAINQAIAVGITALLALGAAYLFMKTGLDLRGFTTPVAIAVSAWVVGELQNIINMVPESYDPTLDFVLKVIVILIAPVGLLVLRLGPQPTNIPGSLL